ncbi:MAG: right-handed parallel beta-helix repeat-containing protein [Planctomycetes bacterium]|nr:right-handed parallel beta-helix repeat-containing protein [Planctomycetota bacterium]
MTRQSSLVGVLVALGASAVLASAQRVLEVPAQYRTIQSAIAAAAASDTVRVAPGRYPERIDFQGKAITVTSSGGAAVTTIDAGGQGSVAIFATGEGPTSVLRGFTLIGGQAASGGGICASLASPTIHANILRENRADSGGGIYLLESRALVFGNTVMKNSAVWDGAGLVCRGGAPTLIANRIADNFEVPPGRDLRGGGVACRRSAAFVAFNEITGNVGGYAGGGIYCGECSPTITDNTIAGNWILGSQATRLSNEAGGAGIYAEFDSTPVIRNNVIVANTCPYRTYGGGVSLWWAGPHVLTNNVIAGNRAESGGGLWVSNAGLVLTNNTIAGNRAGSGGGLDYHGHSVSGTITNTIFRGNRAATGPEIVTEPTLAIDYSSVEGGKSSVSGTITWGAHMHETDPRFVDEAAWDFHLLHPSPCRNAGTAAAPSLPAADFEGDPRAAETAPDIGADEFFPHLYHAGVPTPGGAIEVRLLGAPGSQALWAFSADVVTPPRAVPGRRGLLHLDPASITVIPIGAFGPSGLLRLPITFPPSFPRIAIPTQALIGLDLSNLSWVRLR